MKNAVDVLQIVVSVILIVLIVLQAKGVGLGTTFGGGGEFYRTKRGVEKVVFIGTIAAVGLFFIVSIVSFLVF